MMYTKKEIPCNGCVVQACCSKLCAAMKQYLDDSNIRVSYGSNTNGTVITIEDDKNYKLTRLSYSYLVGNQLYGYLKNLEV